MTRAAAAHGYPVRMDIALRDTASLDTVLIEGLRLEAVIGVYPHEREAPQPLLFDIALRYDNRVPAARDAVADSVDYAAVCKRVRVFLAAREPQLLETLAEALAADLLQVAGVRQVRLRIGKPAAAAALGAAMVWVEVERPLRQGDARG